MSKIADAIHIGFPKTATTWLQSQVLQTHEKIACLGKPYMVDLEYRDIYNEIVSVNEYDFDAGKIRARLEILAEKHQDDIGDKIKVISFERFSGELFSGLDSKQILNRLKAVFGEVRIILTTREQSAEIESIYRHYLKGGGSLHIREFLYKNRSPASDVFGQHHLFQKLRYDVIVKAYKEAFGNENVFVVPFEILKTQGPDAYAQEFLKAIGVSNDEEKDYAGKTENENLSYLGCNILRYVNQIVSTPHSDSPFFRYVGMQYNDFILKPFQFLDDQLFRKISSKKRFVEKKKKWPVLRLVKLLTGRRDPESDDVTILKDVQEAYALPNKNLSEITGIDLKSLGYHS